MFHRRPMIEAVAGQLVGRGRVLVVDRPSDPLSIVARRRRGPLRPPPSRQVTDNLWVWWPTLFVHEELAVRWRLLEDANRAALRGPLSEVARRLFPDPSRVVGWVYAASTGFAIRACPFALRVYEVYDEYTRDVAGRPVASARRRELAFLPSVDVIFVTAEWLLEERRGFGAQVHVLSNGVPAAHQRSRISRPVQLRAGPRSLPRQPVRSNRS